jgi:hypothetical protein
VIPIESSQILWVQFQVRAAAENGIFTANEIDVETCINQLEPEIIAIGNMTVNAMGPGISNGQDLHRLCVHGLGNRQAGEKNQPQTKST